MPNWTQAQTAAIEISGADMLVSAAAGSGKTAALTERILRHIKSGANIERFLIVTFSRASAADMKSKLTRQLRLAAEADPNDKTVERALSELPRVRIGTIHSFCLSVLKRYHAELGLPAKLRIADDAEAKLLRTECMSDTIDYFFSLPEEEGGEFLFLTDQLLGGETDEKLESILLSLYDATLCQASGKDGLLYYANSLEEAAESGDFLKIAAAESVTKLIRRELLHYSLVFSCALSYFSNNEELRTKYSPVFSDMHDFVRSCLSAMPERDFEYLREKFSSYENERLKPVKGIKSPEIEYYKEQKSAFAKFIKEILHDYFAEDTDELCDTFYRTARAIRAVHSVLSEFEKRYDNEKLRLSILDYGDLEHKTYNLLKNRDTADRVASEFDEIYIDECQDINEVQNYIFEFISKNNRFMVGDVKQSIYAFRGADPGLFDFYRNIFKKVKSKDDEVDKKGVAVFMSDNFRCDKTVIDFTNAVCGAVMPCGNVTYGSDDELRHGKTEPSGEPYRAKILITDLSGGEASDGDADADDDDGADFGTSRLDPEAVNIAAEVEELLRSGHRRDGENLRPSDIAILLRSAKGRAEKIEEALRARGIPVSNDTTPNFFESPEILLVLSLLSAVDNPLRDVFLAGALRSPVFAFTLDDLIKLGDRSRRPLYRSLTLRAESEENDPLTEKCRYAKKTLCLWREFSKRHNAYEVIEEIYRQTGIEALLWSDVNKNTGTVPPEVRAANLTALSEYARNYERNSYRGLHRFLDYVNSIIARDVKNPIEKPDVDSNDSVTVMTLHQSKGLEFPVVILGYAAASRNMDDLKGSLLYERGAGLGLRLRHPDGELPIVVDNLPRRAVANAIKDARASEEMRLLYVGLTRAKERIIVSAKLKDAEKTLEKLRLESQFFTDRTVFAEKSYIGWILSAIYAKEADGEDIRSLCDIVVKNRCGEVTNAVKDKIEATEDVPDPILTEEYKSELKAQLSYVYPYKKIGSLPAKMAVSSLYPGVLDEDDDTVEITDGVKEPLSPEAELAAKRGTATHIFMQFCDFDLTEKNGVDAEIERLLSMGFLRSEDAELIIRDEAEEFFRSDIYKKLKTAKKIWREKRFNLRLPAGEFTENEEEKKMYSDEEILVQGVIDCFFIDADGKLILLDYKTDRLSAFEKRNRTAAEKKLSERHSRQLGYYARALGDMFGEPPAHVYVYSLPLGDTVEVDV